MILIMIGYLSYKFLIPKNKSGGIFHKQWLTEEGRYYLLIEIEHRYLNDRIDTSFILFPVSSCLCHLYFD